jgi:hypothetical protein
MTVKAILMYEIVDASGDSVLLTREQALGLTDLVAGESGRLEGLQFVRWRDGDGAAVRRTVGIAPGPAVHVSEEDLAALKALLETT